MYDAGRQQVEYKRLIANLDRVAGIVAALVPRDDFKLLGEQVNDFALTFVAPLSPYDCNDF
jgi:hypothetical protein